MDLVENLSKTLANNTISSDEQNTPNATKSSAEVAEFFIKHRDHNDTVLGVLVRTAVVMMKGISDNVKIASKVQDLLRAPRKFSHKACSLLKVNPGIGPSSRHVRTINQMEEKNATFL